MKFDLRAICRMARALGIGALFIFLLGLGVVVAITPALHTPGLADVQPTPPAPTVSASGPTLPTPVPTTSAPGSTLPTPLPTTSAPGSTLPAPLPTIPPLPAPQIGRASCRERV